MENYFTYKPSSKQYKYGILLSIFAIASVFLAISFGPIVVDNLLKQISTKTISIPQTSLELPGNTFFEAIIAFLNVLLALYVFLDLYWIHPITKDTDKSSTSESFKQLLRGWQLLWFFWILLYGCLFIGWANIYKSLFFHFAADFFDMINGFCFFYLFFVLDHYSVNTKTDKNRATGFRNKLILTFLIGSAAFIISTFVYVQSYNETAFGFLPKFIIDKSTSFFASNLIAAYAAVGMAFFFGRLDSHYLNINRIILAPLYLYAVIQLFWSTDIFSKEPSANRIVIFIMALGLKLVIFYLISKGIREGFFYRYMIDAEKGIAKKRKLELAISTIKEDESVLTLSIQAENNLKKIIDKLQIINSLYVELCQLFNISISKYPLKIIQIESGSVNLDILGAKEIINLIAGEIEKLETFLSYKYTEKGKIQQIDELLNKVTERLEKLIDLKKSVGSLGHLQINQEIDNNILRVNNLMRLLLEDLISIRISKRKNFNSSDNVEVSLFLEK